MDKEKLKSVVTNNPAMGKHLNKDNFDIVFADDKRRELNQKYGGGGGIEAWFPDDEGVGEYKNPNLGKYTIEIYDKELANNPNQAAGAVFRDALHFMAELDPKYQNLRKNFADNFLDTEKNFLQKKYKEENPKLSFDDWMNRRMIEGYIRGGFGEQSQYGELFNKTYRENGISIEAYSPKQREVINQMKQYLAY